MSTKPTGGFWASSVDAQFGWPNWCLAEKYRECEKENSFIFSLKDDAKVLTINYLEDLENLPKIESEWKFSNWIFLDFESISKEYDAIEVVISNDCRLYNALYGWDCDSILILNPNILEIH